MLIHNDLNPNASKKKGGSNSTRNFSSDMWGQRLVFFLKLAKNFVKHHPKKVTKVMEMTCQQKFKAPKAQPEEVDVDDILNHYLPSDDDNSDI